MGRIERFGEDLKGRAERIGGARPTAEAIGDSLGARVGNARDLRGASASATVSLPSSRCHR